MREIRRRDIESRGRDLLELAALSHELTQEEARLTLTGSHDERPAIVTIHFGAGGAIPTTATRCCPGCIPARPASATAPSKS